MPASFCSISLTCCLLAASFILIPRNTTFLRSLIPFPFRLAFFVPPSTVIYTPRASRANESVRKTSASKHFLPPASRNVLEAFVPRATSLRHGTRTLLSAACCFLSRLAARFRSSSLSRCRWNSCAFFLVLRLFFFDMAPSASAKCAEPPTSTGTNSFVASSYCQDEVENERDEHTSQVNGETP